MKIKIVTYADAGMHDLLRISVPNKSRYAARHGYDLTVGYTTLDGPADEPADGQVSRRQVASLAQRRRLRTRSFKSGIVLFRSKRLIEFIGLQPSVACQKQGGFLQVVTVARLTAKIL